MQNFLRTNKDKVLLLIIILIGAFFRFYNLNWDQGHHLHPDERAIVMFTLPLELPATFSEFLSPKSSWNPHFFAYGSFPIYLLKITGNPVSNFDPSWGSYDKINLTGRVLSAFFDLGTLFILFLLTKKIFNKYVGLLAGFFYAISVLPIQLSHFYAVDTPLTFFVLLTLYQLIRFYEKPTLRKAILVGIFFGLSLATKTSAIVLISAIGITIAVDFLLVFLKNPHRPHIWFPHVPKLLKKLFTDGAVVAITTIFTFLILEPYAIIDFENFWRQTIEQSQMTRDAFTFPYTLQYVGKIPYLYEFKNVFLWGLGPILATLSFLGLFYVIYKTIKQPNNKTIILLTFFLIYFAVVGKFAVGWMRYMLPLYPLLSLFAAAFFYQLTKLKIFKQSFLLSFIFHFSFFILILIWPLSFISIYSKPNTRVLASEWINKNISIGSTIATEHWDDGLPLGTQANYKIQELPIYEMQNPIREAGIYQTIQETDYIIIASNRLYIPLQRIAQNCENWGIPQERCPQNANIYYQQLFSGELGYKKVAEFENPPKIPILNIPINDQSADESFTVYDHPKVMIFKKDGKVY